MQGFPPGLHFNLDLIQCFQMPTSVHSSWGSSFMFVPPSSEGKSFSLLKACCSKPQLAFCFDFHIQLLIRDPVFYHTCYPNLSHSLRADCAHLQHAHVFAALCCPESCVIEVKSWSNSEHHLSLNEMTTWRKIRVHRFSHNKTVTLQLETRCWS